MDIKRLEDWSSEQTVTVKTSTKIQDKKILTSGLEVSVTTGLPELCFLGTFLPFSNKFQLNIVARFLVTFCYFFRSDKRQLAS